MKKTLVIIVLAMVAALALCLVGCSNSSNSTNSTQVSSSAESSSSSEDSTSNKVKNAKTFDSQKFFEMRDSNAARAKSEYDGENFKVTGIVDEISENYLVVDTFNYSGDLWANPFKVFLSEQDLIKLNKGDKISFVGTFTYNNAPNLSEFHSCILL